MGNYNQEVVRAALPYSANTDLFSVQALVQFNHLMPREIWRWRDALIEKHRLIAKFLVSGYIATAKKQGYRAANNQLREIDQNLTVPTLSELGTRFVDGQADIGDDEIKALAKRYANCCDEVFETASRWGFVEGIDAVDSVVIKLGFTLPVKRKDTQTERGRNDLAAAVARVSDERWWRRALRTSYARIVEQQLRLLGHVRAQKGCYVSDYSCSRWKQAQKRNRAVLERLEAVNEQGDVCNLLDAVDASVANPSNRRIELMVRSKGFEEIAIELGYESVFLTLTAPSKYHAYHRATGARNTKYNGSTPAQAMCYLNSVWSRIRAKWARLGIQTFGFRVAEPHHDGCPHFHFLLFIDPNLRTQALEVFRSYALKEDRDEPGAEKRCDCVVLDPSKGSATGYIAKYVAKNIDGLGVDKDFESEQNGIDGAARVRAWASLWGVRQFQPICTVSVTVWRELRRCKQPLTGCDEETAEALRKAADQADWAEFVELMGGVTVSRAGQTLRIHKPSDDEAINRYGDAIRRILGVLISGTEKVIKTRIHTWIIRDVHSPERSEAIAVEAKPPPLDLCQ